MSGDKDKSAFQSPVVAVAVASVAAVGVVSAITFRRLAAVENSHNEVKSHVGSLGRMLEKYPTSAAIISLNETIGSCSSEIAELRAQVDKLEDGNAMLTAIINILIKEHPKHDEIENIIGVFRQRRRHHHHHSSTGQNVPQSSTDILLRRQSAKPAPASIPTAKQDG